MQEVIDSLKSQMSQYKKMLVCEEELTLKAATEVGIHEAYRLIWQGSTRRYILLLKSLGDRLKRYEVDFERKQQRKARAENKKG